MSTLATADLGPSDDEGDTDFVLPDPKAKRSKKRGANGKRIRSGSQSGSDGESSGSSDEDGDDADDDADDEVKRLRAEHAEAQAAERKRRAADAFKAMQDEARAPVKAAGEVKAAAAAEVEMVEVKRPRRFAGETIYETVRLPKDDPEAVKYLAQVAAEATATATPAAHADGDGTGATPTPNVDSSAASASSSAAATPASPLAAIAETTASTLAAAPPPPAASAPPPPRRGPPMRKRPRQSLEAMSAALDKGKKMTTLEKSQMDWNSHMATETKLADEVAQHRKTGGFLEKQAFLERVGERRAMPPRGGSGSSRRG